MRRPDIAPSSEQTAIIEQIEGSFAVLASAGSGKTYVLSERYLKLVRDHQVRPSEILTITFTKKAAAEMKKRIVGVLREAELYDAAQEAETGPIQTIHGFCERILRENSVAAGLDPQFEICNEGQGAILMRMAIRRAVGYAESGSLVSGFVQSLVGRAGNLNESSYASLEFLTKSVVDKFRSSGWSMDDLLKLHSDPREYLAHTHELVLRQLPDAVQVAVAEEPGSSWYAIAEKKLKELKLKTRYAWMKSNISAENELQCAALTCGLAQLAIAAWQLYLTDLRREQLMDFSELESQAVGLLQNNLSVRQRVAKQYRYLMVDESQDVNPVQFQLIDAILAESKMFVGDEKQSIFGFRYADLNGFRARTHEKAFRLSRNYRSTPNLQRFIDDVFGGVMGANYTPMTEPTEINLDVPEILPTMEDVERWPLSSGKNWSDLAKHVIRARDEGTALREMLILVTDNRGASAIESSLKSAGLRVRMLAGANKYFARLEVQDLANTLLALTDPTDSFAHLVMLRSPVVGISLDDVVLLGTEGANVRDILNEYRPIDEEQRALYERFLRWFMPLAQVADRLPAWEVMSRILAESDLLVHLAKRENGRQRIENTRKLLTLAAREQEMTATEFAARIRHIDVLRSRESDAPIVDDQEDLVTIMTIHGAKGLEWDHVIIADGPSHMGKGGKGDHFFDPTTGWLAYQGGKGLTTFIYQYLKEHSKEMGNAELIRLQYVALTRPRKKLSIVCYETRNSNSSLTGLIQKGIGSARFDSIPLRNLQVAE